MEKALSWQQVLVVLLAFALIPFLALAFGGNIEPEHRIYGYLGLLGTLGLGTGLFLWDRRNARRTDLRPDVLIQFFNEQQIMQVDLAHVSVTAFQDGGVMRVLVAAQGIYDGVLGLKIEFQSPGPVRIPPFETALQNAAAIAACIDLPLPPIAYPTAARVDLTGGCWASAKGKQVRFGRRNVISRKVSTGATVAAAAAGALYFGGGQYLTIPLQPFDPRLLTSRPLVLFWRTVTLWSTDHPRSSADMKAHLDAVLQPDPATVPVA